MCRIVSLQRGKGQARSRKCKRQPEWAAFARANIRRLGAYSASGFASGFVMEEFLAYRWRNLSIRPAVSMILCLPV